MAKAKKKAFTYKHREPPKKRYVIVHRGSANGVLEVGKPFEDENDGTAHVFLLLRSINFFPGDSLHMEEEAGQAKEAENA